MKADFISVYTFVSILLAIFNLYYAREAFRRPGKTGRYLGCCALMAMVVNISYLCSILTHDYFRASLFSSIYFISIDWLLISLVTFTARFTETFTHRFTAWFRRGFVVYGIFDSAVLLFNVYHEIAVHYVDRGTEFASFGYQMLPLYTGHLAFSYLMVVIVMVILIRKIVTTPQQYRNPFLFTVLAILLVVATNAVFLFRDSNELFALLDFSILGYSLGLYLMFWAAFSYREKNMLDSLAMTIFSNLDQGIVLFDYEGKHILHNKMAEHLLREVRFRHRMTMRDFITACELPLEREDDEYSLLLPQSSLRCSFRRMRDDDDKVIGNLFVFSDITSDYDPLTGFMIWEKFQHYAMENPGRFPLPSSVVLFDIIGLEQVNRSFGREVGNQRIRNLVKIMQDHLPPSTFFVRGYEAHLVGICAKMEEETLAQYVERILEENDGTVKYGMATVTPELVGEERSILRAVEKASRSMQVKKLLDPATAHSQTITSLVRTLRESDSDTEGHVRRTQKMGELLGKRIRLSDAELSDLKLLCLLHDIGKVGIPLEILNKPGKLTEAEVNVLHSHAEKGYQIAMSSEELKPIAQMILCHHECWDGSGYPRGLSGKNIPLLSRVISIVDAYDAMVNNRSYRRGKSPEEAQEELRKNSGTQFDPNLTEEFLTLLRENPELGLGEKTGGEGPRVRSQHQEVKEPVFSGNITPVPYCRYLLDVDENIIEVDPKFESLTGYTSFDVLSGHMRQFDLIPEGERDEYIAQVSLQFSKSNIAYLEHNIQRKDGGIQRVCCLGKHYFDSVEKAFRSEIVFFAIPEPKSVQ